MAELFVQNLIPEKTMSEILSEGAGTGFSYGQSAEQGGTYINPRIIGGILEGASFRSGVSGARIEMFPGSDNDIGMVVYDDAEAEIFKILTAGTNVGDIIMGDYSNNKYVMWDKSAVALALGSAATVGGRLASTLASAIDASGHFIDANLNTSAKTILKDFTFGSDDYSGAFKTGDIAWNADTGAITGGSGSVYNKAGLIFATDGVATITLNGVTGAATFAGELSAATGSFAGSLSAATGTFSGSLTVGTDLDNMVTANLPSDENLVGYWAFDEGAGSYAYDGSGNNNTGTLTNMEAADWVDGVAGGALSFDGTNEYIQVANSATMTDFDQMSCSLWIYPEAWAGGTYYRHIIDKGWSNNGSFVIYFDRDTAGDLYLVTKGSGGSTKYAHYVLPSLNAWYHIICVFQKGEKHSIYVNGELAAESTTAAADESLNDTNGLRIAQSSNDFKGKISSVRIWKNQALTAKEAYALYKNPAAQPSLAVPIGRLTSGSIYSKQILLAVAAGTGDSYIAGGNNLDFDNWYGGDGSGGAVMFGLDDNDSDKGKFFCGNYSTKQFMKWDDTLDLTAERRLAYLKAGENLTAGDIVCIKPDYDDVVATGDTYVYENAADTNYGTDEYLYSGLDLNSKTYRTFLYFDLSAYSNQYEILRAELMVYCETKTGTPNDPEIELVTENFAEGTGAEDGSEVCWNNQPTISSHDIETEYGGEDTATAATGWLTWDITPLVRHWIADKDPYGTALDTDNEHCGLRIDTGGGAEKYLKFKSTEAAGEEAPKIRIWTTKDIDITNGYVFKANCNDYLLCRHIIGVATANITAAASGFIQTDGENDDLGESYNGGIIYLSTIAGGITPDAINANRVITLGYRHGTSDVQLDIQRKDILIERLPIDSTAEYGATTSMRYIYAPADARYALLHIADTSYEEVVRLERGSDELSSYTHYEESGGATFAMVWNSAGNYITFDAGNATGQLKGIYFYT